MNHNTMNVDTKTEVPAKKPYFLPNIMVGIVDKVKSKTDVLALNNKANKIPETKNVDINKITLTTMPTVTISHSLFTNLISVITNHLI